MSEIISGICARLKPFLQKIGVSSSPNTSKVPRTYRTAGGAESLVLTEYLGMVLDSANSLLGIINDILDFSRIKVT